jgi:hypothetical protein
LRGKNSSLSAIKVNSETKGGRHLTAFFIGSLTKLPPLKKNMPALGEKNQKNICKTAL